MRSSSLRVLVLLMVAAVPAIAQQVPVAPAPSITAPAAIALEEIVKRAADSESTIISNLKAFKPIVEVYLQNVVPDEALAVTPTEDTYVLGRFNWRNGPRLQTLSGGTDAPRVSATNAAGKRLQYVPDGFVAMLAPDWGSLDDGRYSFTVVRREFVGETRCFVIDVKPTRNMRDGFSGRIWVEDRDYNIVRFNGINRRLEREFFRQDLSFHIDSWRTNVLPGLWLPSYVYVEEIEPDAPSSTVRRAHVRSQVRVWGYDPRKAQTSSLFTNILIDAPQVQDNAGHQGQLSPVLSARQWETEAESNVLERLDKAALLATPGEVEKVLETVINNLEVTNDLTLDRPVRVRVLLTAPFESFTVGHTIVLSRGLIDVLPDEASLAMMLAHELAHVALGHPLIDTQFAFGDRLMVSDEDLLRLLQLKRTPAEEAAADEKVLEMLETSPYKGKLADSGLFLKIVAVRGTQLRHLIQPHIGDHIAQGGQIMRLTQVMQAAPELKTERLDQIAALPLGARLALDPWSSRLELIRNAAQLPGSARERVVPLAISPLIPYLKYMEAPPLFRP
jgi:peptidase M48-like protein